MISVLWVKGPLKGGIEKGRVVVGRRRALLRLPVTLQDGRLVATVTGLVRQRPLVLAHCEGKKPAAEKRNRVTETVSETVHLNGSAAVHDGKRSEARRHHLLGFASLAPLSSIRCLSSSEGRTMPLSLCSPWEGEDAGSAAPLLSIETFLRVSHVKRVGFLAG